MRIFWILVGAAVVSTVVVTIVGIALLVTDPEPGSDAESTLGVLAALSGLATGLLFAAAAIYASVRRLWEHMHPWVGSIQPTLDFNKTPFITSSDTTWDNVMLGGSPTTVPSVTWVWKTVTT